MEAAIRAVQVRRGLRLEYFTVAYNSAEALIALVAGAIAGSIALTGFGIDSLIEVSSGAALIWRLHSDSGDRERIERITLRLVGASFLALAGYVAYEALESMAWRRAPERSLPGVALAAVSVVVMPVLARAKRRVAARISSGRSRRMRGRPISARGSRRSCSAGCC